jgi:hypothetical protein
MAALSACTLRLLRPNWNALAQPIAFRIAPGQAISGGYTATCAAQGVHPYHLGVICAGDAHPPYVAGRRSVVGQHPRFTYDDPGQVTDIQRDGEAVIDFRPPDQ